jgi:hypothetical protein
MISNDLILQHEARIKALELQMGALMAGNPEDVWLTPEGVADALGGIISGATIRRMVNRAISFEVLDLRAGEHFQVICGVSRKSYRIHLGRFRAYLAVKSLG